MDIFNAMVLTDYLILIIIILIILIIIFTAMNNQQPITDTNDTSVTSVMIGNSDNLGDQLFQLSAVIGVADSNNVSVVLHENVLDTYLAQLIDLSKLNIKPISSAIPIDEPTPGIYENIIIPKDGHIHNINGNFQSYLYFAGVRNKIHDMFKIRQEIIDNTIAKFPSCIMPNSIGIHVEHDNTTTTRCTIEYYRVALEKILTKIPPYDSYSIIICSNDIEWCKNNFAKQNNFTHKYIIYAENSSWQEDFTLLTLCQHQIMSNTSFSWWSAYLKSLGSIHHIIAPYPWCKSSKSDKSDKSSKLSDPINTNEIYYPTWDIIDIDKLIPYLDDSYKTLIKLSNDRLHELTPSDYIISNSTKSDEYKKNLYGDVYVVSLNKSKDRFESARKILSKIGIAGRRFPAIDKDVIKSYGGKKGLEDNNLISDKDLEHDGIIGCGLSHICTWISGLNNETNKVTIFEDDIITYINEDDLDEKIENALHLMDSDWDILYLGKCTDKCQLYEKVDDGLYRTYYPLCMHAYMISALGIKKILRQPLYTGIDTQLLNDIKNGVLKAYAMQPSIFVQNIVKWSSSLRNFKNQINNQNDCGYIK